MGSFFTHHFVSALLGAADDDGDGRITLSEVYAYTFQETVKNSALTLAGAQHPSYRYDVRGQGELVLSRAEARRGQGGQVVPVDHGALVVDVTGAVVAELGARGARRLTLGPGRYRLLVRGPRALYEGDVDVRANADVDVDLDALQKTDYARLVRKGGSGTTWQLTPRALATTHTPWLLDAFGAAGHCPGASVGLAVETEHITVVPRVSACVAQWQNAFLSATDSEVAVDVGVLHAFDFPLVSVAVGAAVGAMVFHQEFVTSGVAPPQTSVHPTLGVLGELDVPLPLGFGIVVSAEARSIIMAVRDSEKVQTPLVGVFGAGSLRLLTFGSDLTPSPSP